MKLKLDGLPDISSNGAHGSWRAKAGKVRAWKQAIFCGVGYHLPKVPLKKARIICTRHSSNEPDFDNLAISFKPLIDGLKMARVIADDKMSNIGRPEYLWQKAARGKGFVTIQVLELTDDAILLTDERHKGVENVGE